MSNFSAVSGDEFWRICKGLDTPCGLEERRCGDILPGSNKTRIKYEKTTLRMTLDRAAKLHPGYHWAIKNGVLNFEPVNETAPNRLSRKIDQISLDEISSHEAACLILKKAGFSVCLSSFSGPPRFYALIKHLDMKDVTVRDALNQIAKLDGHVMWRVCPDARGGAHLDFGMWSWGKSGIEGDAYIPVSNGGKDHQ